MNKIKLETPQMMLKELFEVLKKNSYFFNSTVINKKINICYNSKDLNFFIDQKKSENFVYFAKYGKNFDGHCFLQEIIETKNFIIAERSRIAGVIESPYVIYVENIECALNKILEKLYLINPLNLKSIAVTGTNGKTSVTQFLGQMLEAFTQKNILKIGTLGIQYGDDYLAGSHVTTPEYSLFLRLLDYANTANIEFLVIEVSSHGLKEKRTGNYLFDVGIFTNFTLDHLDYHETLEDYFDSKKRLFVECLKNKAAVIVCTVSHEWKSIIQASKGKDRKLFIVSDRFSTEEREYFINLLPDFLEVHIIYMENTLQSIQGLSSDIVLLNPNNKEIRRVKIEAHIIGQFNIDNILCVVSACLYFGYDLEEIAKFLKMLKGVSGRLQRVNRSTDLEKPTFIVDYAHSPDALEKAIKTCLSLLLPNKKLCVVFGCGGERDTLKRPEMGRISAQYAHLAIVTSDNPRTEDPHEIINQILKGISNKHNVLVEVDRKKAIEMAFKLSEKGDIILIAGKGHEDYQIVGQNKFYFSDVDEAKKLLEG